jgi:hypothetical protein
MGSGRGKHVSRGSDFAASEPVDELSSDEDPRLPEGFTPTNSSTSHATGGRGGDVHLSGLTIGQGLVIAGIACIAFGISVHGRIADAQARADMRAEFSQAREDMRSRYEESYSKLEREVRLKTQAVDELRVEINTARKLQGLPPINYQEHD